MVVKGNAIVFGLCAVRVSNLAIADFIGENSVEFRHSLKICDELFNWIFLGKLQRIVY